MKRHRHVWGKWFANIISHGETSLEVYERVCRDARCHAFQRTKVLVPVRVKTLRG